MEVEILSDFLWKRFGAKLERFLLVRQHDKAAIFFSAENAHAYESGRISLCTDIAHEKIIAGLPQICILTLSLRNLTEFLHTSLQAAPASMQHIKGKEH